MAVDVKTLRLSQHPKDHSFLGFYEVITRDDWQEFEWDLDYTLHMRSVYAFADELGLLNESQRAELAEIDAFFRAHPKEFDRAFGEIIARADLTTTLAEWVRDENGRPVPVPPSHWWWRTSDRW